MAKQYYHVEFVQSDLLTLVGSFEDLNKAGAYTFYWNWALKKGWNVVDFEENDRGMTNAIFVGEDAEGTPDIFKDGIQLNLPLI